jgi:hypothetical protein
MRSIKLTWVLAAIAAITALSTPTASATRHLSAHAGRHAAGTGGCRMRINVAPRYIQSGESTAVFGQLACPAKAASPLPAGQTVTIFANSAAGPPSGAIGTTTTDEHGNYSFTTPALQSNSQLYAVADGIKSTRRPVKVSPRITLTGPPDGSQLFTGAGPFVRAHLRRSGLSNKVVFSGSVSPANAGAVVALQRESSVGAEEWRAIAWSTVGQGGTYSIAHTFSVPGDVNIRVVVHAPTRNAPGASEPLSYEISQAQNPALTIESSADPVSFGQLVTIGGKLASATPATLTLFARTHLQHDFVPVASTTSGAGGAYSFAAQTPTQSTFYKVAGAGKTSAHLFEGVRYGVTASASAAAVSAGQPVTVSGTVTPAHEGHPVYLQMLSRTGIGYHTVEVATVGHDGAYVLAHTFYTAGARKLRVKVPGDPENQGAATAAVALEVTQAPAASLTPEAPGNSTPPSQGRL